MQTLVQNQSTDTSFHKDYPNPHLFYNETAELQLHQQLSQIPIFFLSFSFSSQMFW